MSLEEHFLSAKRVHGTCCTESARRWKKITQKNFPVKLVAAPETVLRDEHVLTAPAALIGIKVANLSPAVASELDMDQNALGVVVSNVLLDEPVLEGRLAARGSGLGLAPIIPPGMRAVSVRVNDVGGGGWLRTTRHARGRAGDGPAA